MQEISTSDDGRRRALAAALALLLLLGGCATSEEAADEDSAMLGYEEPADPLETPNRLVFAFNHALDTTLIEPAARTYRFLLPEELRRIPRNFLRNLATPVILANDLMQGELERAETTLARFIVNSTAGAGGLGDVAGELGLAYHDEDFGQTLAVHGAGDGFYIVLPLLGPSNLRDGVGVVADIFLDPLTYALGTRSLLGRGALEGLDYRAQNIETFEEIERDAVDLYARVRSLYYQRRQAAIENRSAGEAAPGYSARTRPPLAYVSAAEGASL